jgi:hypothetical protein
MTEEIQETIDEISLKTDGFLEIVEAIAPKIEEVLEKEKVTELVAKLVCKAFSSSFTEVTKTMRKTGMIKDIAVLTYESYNALLDAGFSRSEAMQIICSRK